MAHLLNPLALGLAIAVMGCAPRTPEPPLAPHTGDAPMPVPYPPPTPKAEEIGRQPSETAVWVDGQWRFNGAGYVWTAGTWVEPRPGWAYAPPTVVRLRDGELLYYEGVWKEWSPSSEEPDAADGTGS